MEIRGKSIAWWRQNAEENYPTTPISVLKYITVLEEYALKLQDKPVTELNERNSVDEAKKSFYCLEIYCGVRKDKCRNQCKYCEEKQNDFKARKFCP